MNTLVLDQVTKTLQGHTVLDHVSLSLESGKIYGLVGRNGSGKTMLIRSISGMVRPTSGAIRWNGKQLYQEIDYIPRLGLLIENIGLYPEFTGFQNLKLLAGIQKRITDADIREAIIRVGLDPDDNRPIRKYSLGMKQKITLAQAFMEKPELLMLDEPTNALDEASVARVRDDIKAAAAQGAIVLLASHNKEDISCLCDVVYFMEEGKLSVMQ
ncbi:MAG: ABC transporter ATP-binding protein [Oscillospiraceae bacterium]|nr:ABC transporter ATP-binding protein [Oscillospiraceae bacterium]